jgi:protein SCO1/2
MTAWMLALLGCGSTPDPPPVPERAASTHGTLLHLGKQTVLVQHDDLRGRIVTGVERYQKNADLDLLPLTAGDHIDLWLDGPEGQQTLEYAVKTGADAVSDSIRSGGHALKGTVVNVDGIRVSVDHEPIEGVMPAMVMGFGLAPWEAGALSPGDVIEGRLLSTDYGWQLVDPVKVGESPVELRSDVKPVEVGQVLPRTELVAEDGTSIVVGEGQGTRTLLTYIYTQCPDPTFCPAIGARLAGLQSKLDGGRIVTVTLDPENDTTQVLAAWGELMGADTTKWRLARAEPLVLQELALRGGQRVTVDGGRISHLHRILILDEDGALIERYDDDRWPTDRVVEQLATGAPRAEFSDGGPSKLDESVPSASVPNDATVDE